MSILLLFLWLHFWERRPFSTVGFRHGHGVKRFFAGVLGGFLAMAVATLVLVAMGKYEFGASQHTTTGLAALLPVVAVMVVWLVQASSEEILMRGYLLQVSGNQLPGWLAIFLVSFGFAAIHMHFDPLVLANITLVAVFFSFISLAHGNLWAACGFHVAWNTTPGSILGIPVSGNPYTVSLLALGPAKDAHGWLTGGDYGSRRAPSRQSSSPRSRSGRTSTSARRWRGVSPKQQKAVPPASDCNGGARLVLAAYGVSA